MDGMIGTGWWIALVLYVLGLPMMSAMSALAGSRIPGVVRLGLAFAWPVVVAVLSCVAVWEFVTE